jgi:dihydroorotase
MKPILIHQANIVNEGTEQTGSILVEGNFISKIYRDVPSEVLVSAQVIDARGKHLLPGIIDDQVHFREPGLTHKADIYSEAKAAVAGGTTSFMEMPNTQPQTTTQDLLEQKYTLAASKSLANYSFYMGATNDNIEEIEKTNPANVCGIKVFMGASTGNMLVDNPDSLQRIFANAPVLVAVHCEDETTIKANSEKYKAQFGEDIPIQYHPLIRSEEACFRSSALAVELASKHNTRLHILHLSTTREMSLFNNQLPSAQKQVTAEVCVHHLWFSDADYARVGSRIKWNPAVKTANDREALFSALLDGRIDVVATDHAPHTLEEKENPYFKCPSGAPLVQHSLVAMLEFVQQGRISIAKVVEKMSHAPADIFKIDRRGYIREGYYADLVLVDMNSPWMVSPGNILYKCGWSPLEGTRFHAKVSHTFVNGHLVFENGQFDESRKGQRLLFNR